VRHSTATVIPRLPQMSFGTFLSPLDRATSGPSWVQPVVPSLPAARTTGSAHRLVLVGSSRRFPWMPQRSGMWLEPTTQCLPTDGLQFQSERCLAVARRRGTGDRRRSGCLAHDLHPPTGGRGAPRYWSREVLPKFVLPPSSPIRLGAAPASSRPRARVFGYVAGRRQPPEVFLRV
jgi:hypothetical protein